MTTASESFQIDLHHNIRVVDIGANGCELHARSPFSGQMNTLIVPGLNAKEMCRRIVTWKSKRLLIQNVFPELNADEREFLMTGITAQEWDENFLPADE